MSCRPAPVVAMMLALCLTVACAARVDPATIADAELAVRVKTALVNDSEIGPYPIAVRAVGGAVRLTGRVPTAAADARAVAIARGVPGVRAVTSEMVVGGDAATQSAAVLDVDADDDPDMDLLGAEADRQLLAVGATVGWNGTSTARLDARSSLGPLLRIGRGRGLGLAVGFGWFGADLRSTTGAGGVVGEVRIRPVMAGIGYTARQGRASVTVSALAGLALNSVDPSTRPTSGQIPLDVGNSLVWRPGASFWFETSSRTALNLQVGYVMTRPRLTVLEGDVVARRGLNADTLLVRVGLAYKVF